MTAHLRQILFVSTIALVAASTSLAQDKYAVLIGVESYDPSVLGRLEFAEEDAIALGQSFKELGFNTKVMTGQATISTAKPNTPEKILRVLKTQMNNCADGDTMVVSLSGHGLQFEDDEADENGVRESYFCPEDADPSDKSTLLPIGDVIELLRQCRASRKLLLVDACRNEFAETSGQKKAAKRLKLASVHETRRNIPSGMFVLFSCDQKQFSFEHEDLEHSVFSYFVIKYLSGNAEERYYENGKLKVDGLTLYVLKKTNSYVSENNLSADGQAPVFSGSSGNWILGESTNPARALLQKHLDWIGGPGNIRKIKTMRLEKATNITVDNGEQLDIDQTSFVKSGLVTTKTEVFGETHRQGVTPSFGWVTEMDKTVRPMDDRERDMTWLTSHPVGLLEMLERYEEFRVGKETISNGIACTELIFGDDTSYMKFLIAADGELVGTEMLSRGQTVRSSNLKYSTVEGVKFAHSSSMSIENDTFSGQGSVRASIAINPQIPQSEFNIPGNVPRTSKPSVDIDKVVSEYNNFKQEIIARSEGTLSDVRFRKIASDTIAVDLSLAEGVYENTDPSFWHPETLKPLFIREEMEPEDREVVKAGITLMVTYKRTDGLSASQFNIVKSDF